MSRIEFEGRKAKYITSGDEPSSGGQGDVRKAISQKTGNICAIKDFKKNARACKRELEFLRSFSHPSIIRYVDHNTAFSFMAVEWIEGGTLAQQHHKKPFTHREVEMVVHDALDALAYIHLRGIIHHDIKPPNLLVEMRDENKLSIKVIDFGLASPKSQSNIPNGTAIYFAPEKFKPTALWTGKLDVWSLGLIGLDLLGGLVERPQRLDAKLAILPNSPYADGWRGSIHAQLEKFLKRNILSSTNPDLIATLATMLEVNPVQRVSAHEALMNMRPSELEVYLSIWMTLEE